MPRFSSWVDIGGYTAWSLPSTSWPSSRASAATPPMNVPAMPRMWSLLMAGIVAAPAPSQFTPSRRGGAKIEALAALPAVSPRARRLRPASTRTSLLPFRRPLHAQVRFDRQIHSARDFPPRLRRDHGRERRPADRPGHLARVEEGNAARPRPFPRPAVAVPQGRTPRGDAGTQPRPRPGTQLRRQLDRARRRRQLPAGGGEHLDPAAAGAGRRGDPARAAQPGIAGRLEGPARYPARAGRQDAE